MKGAAGWILAAALALAATLVLTAALKGRLKAQRAASQTVARDAGTSSGCQIPAAVAVRALPDADDPPVILWGVGPVRFFLDGQPTFSAPEEPRHFKTGAHALRVETDGGEPLKTTVRFDAFTPALFHAQVDERVGITLVGLGAPCVACKEPLDEVRLGYQASSVREEGLLAGAAASLRGDDWTPAAEFLKGVSPGSRNTPLFHRLASGVYRGARQIGRAREEMEAIAPKQSNDLAGLLKQLDALAASETERRGAVVKARWNKLTERFQAVIERFDTQAPGPVAQASHRLAELSSAFDDAVKAKDVFEQEKVLAAADEGLLSVVVQVRAARPGDCDFQASVVATAMR